MLRRQSAFRIWTTVALRLALLAACSSEVRAAQYNTSAANSWIQLEADDSFSGRNGESVHGCCPMYARG